MKMVPRRTNKTFGGLVSIIGLVILIMIAIFSFQVGLGLMPVPIVGEPSMGAAAQVFFGIMLQTFMFFILIAIGYVLMRFGVNLILSQSE